MRDWSQDVGFGRDSCRTPAQTPGRSGGGSRWPLMVLLVLVAAHARHGASEEPPAEAPAREPSPVRLAAAFPRAAANQRQFRHRADVSLLLDCAIAGNCNAVEPEMDTHDPSVAGYRYAYAPSIVREGETIHLFYCSLGVVTGKEGNSHGSGDGVRYARSNDGGETWSAPRVVVKATFHDAKVDRHACDPSVVFFNGAYYLYYSSAFVNRRGLNQTTIQVARSPAIGGPYLTFTERGTWEDTPINPARIIEPLRERSPSAMPSYGAGQSTLVMKDDLLHMWYTDDSTEDGGQGDSRWAKVQVRYTRSRDGLNWSPPSVVSADPVAGSIDIKYDPGSDQFVMAWVLNHSRCARVLASISDDGIRWGPTQTVLPPAATPRYANNLGLLGDRNGWLTEGSFLVLAAGDDLAADEECGVPPGTLPLTRLKFSAPRGDQFVLTSSAEEIQRIEQGGWKSEGIQGNVYSRPDAAPGLVPLRRFFYPSTGDHVLTSLASEDDLAQRGYREVGIEGYVFSELVEGSMPLYRIYNLETKLHRYTTSRIEYFSAPATWKRDGIIGFLVAPQKEPNWGLWSLYRAEIDLRGGGR